MEGQRFVPVPGGLTYSSVAVVWSGCAGYVIGPEPQIGTVERSMSSEFLSWVLVLFLDFGVSEGGQMKE